jgi:hypothetical protein
VGGQVGAAPPGKHAAYDRRVFTVRSSDPLTEDVHHILIKLIYQRQEVTGRWFAHERRSSAGEKYLVPQALWRRMRCVRTLRRFALQAAARRRIRMCSDSCVLAAAQMLR